MNGKRFAVSVYVPESQLAPVARWPAAKPRPKRGGGGGGAAAAAGSGKIAVPMQGTVVKVLVEAGQSVTAGEPVVVLEAMKMENNVNADVDGVVAEVRVEPGQSVAAGEIVLIIDAARPQPKPTLTVVRSRVGDRGDRRLGPDVVVTVRRVSYGR